MRALGHAPRQTKVAQLVLIAVHSVHQYVLGFQIAMQNAVRMQVVQGGHQLAGQTSGPFLGDRFLAIEQFVQITSSEFRDDRDLLVRFEGVENLNDVRMGETVLDGEFLAEVLDFFVRATDLGFVGG